MTYKEACAGAIRRLEAAEVPEAKENALLLFEHVCGTKRQDLYLYPERKLSGDEQTQLEELVSARIRRIPLQQLTGVQYFMGLEFKVNGSVLIPRQDTEILIERVLKDGVKDRRLLDLCTGSGCIPISIVRYGKPSFSAGCDISHDALNTARENAGILGADVLFYEGDLFEALPGELKGSFDIITANPPYIRSGDIAGLMPEVRDHEPLGALDGGADGLVFYRRIADEAGKWLKDGGRIYMEIGFDQASDVSAIFAGAGYGDIEVIKDYAGMDRVVCVSSAA